MDTHCRRPAAAASLLVAAVTFAPHALHAADALTWQQKELFLTKAKITHVAEAKKGVTGTLRVTLSDGTLTHDASVQSIDEYKQLFLGEVGFKDSYKFDIAGWKLARLLALDDRVPPSVKRTYDGKTASFTWWIDDIQMDEEDRRAKNLQAPDQEAWQRDYNIMQVFDQLIYNMDLNQTNILIDKGWHIWMIDHSRAFRVHKTLKDPSVLKGIDRETLAKMKTLDEATLTKEFARDVTKDEIHGLLARRDVIVKFFDDKGPSVQYERPPRN
ncbi:MAG TPA: hypothetical protein VGJ09_08870 [Bryobacteraceae bacterium]|jgi:hypothetical protein